MELSQRIERLERRNVVLTTLVVAFVLCVICVGAAPNQKVQPSDHVDTKSLRLFDDQGRLRMLLAASPKGNATVTILDQSGKVCAVLGVGDEANPSLELSHSDKTLRARLALAPDGQPVLEFYDAAGKVIQHLPQ